MSSEAPATGPKPKKSVALSGIAAGNTALCTVGKHGNDLSYRGYDILEIADRCEFEEIAHLLVHGKLPNAAQLANYKLKLKSLRGLPQENIRYHICWGSWNGPHTSDVPLPAILDLILKVKAQALSFEAANPRHAHEVRVWEDAKLPDGKILLPGMISHSTNVVEHPELISMRICAFAKLVGRENVIASTDCGLGGRVHPEIAWAKLKTLSEGAALATKRLWG